MSVKSYLRSNAPHQPEIIDLYFKIVATVAQDSSTHLATSIVSISPKNDVAVMVNTGITQAQIDAFLSTSGIVSASDVLATTFGATRLGTDMAGFIINMESSVRQLYVTKVAYCLTAKGALSHLVSVPTGSALADADAGSATFEVSAAGNVYGSMTVSGLDSASAGIIHIQLACRLK